MHIQYTRRVRVVIGFFHYVPDGLRQSVFSAIRIAQTDTRFQRRGRFLYARLCTVISTGKNK